MDADRITDEPGDRQEQGREEPFADLTRIDARVKRIVADGAAIRLRNRLIQEAAKTTALGTASLGAIIVAVVGYATLGASISKSEAAMMQFCCCVGVLFGFLTAISWGKTERAWRSYRRDRGSNSRTAITDMADG